MGKLYFDYGFGNGGLGVRIYHSGKEVHFIPDPERGKKPKGYERKVR